MRTPIGRYEGGLARVRADDLAATVIKQLVGRHPGIAEAVDEVFMGCANQAGEDNRMSARMALLLSGLPAHVPGVTLNRLCASGLDAVGAAARALRAGEIELAIAGGVESHDAGAVRHGKGGEGLPAHRGNLRHGPSAGVFVNAQMKALYGVDSMPETGENVAADFHVSARGAGRLCVALAAAGSAGSRGRRARRTDRAGIGARRERRAPLK